MASKWIVCPRCQGEGQVSNPAIDGNGITASEMEELGPEFREDYFAGVYDIVCPECKGQRVTTRSKHTAFLKDEEEEWADRRVRLMESGIYPGHPDYF